MTPLITPWKLFTSEIFIDRYLIAANEKLLLTCKLKSTRVKTWLNFNLDVFLRLLHLFLSFRRNKRLHCRQASCESSLERRSPLCPPETNKKYYKGHPSTVTIWIPDKSGIWMVQTCLVVTLSLRSRQEVNFCYFSKFPTFFDTDIPPQNICTQYSCIDGSRAVYRMGLSYSNNLSK